MKLKKCYFICKGKHQEKADKVFKLFNVSGELYDKDKKSKQLKRLARLVSFYIDVYYHMIVYSLGHKNRVVKKSYLFTLAMYRANDTNKHKYKYKCKSLSQLEKMIDKLILKAYKEQKKLGKI